MPLGKFCLARFLSKPLSRCGSGSYWLTLNEILLCVRPKLEAVARQYGTYRVV